VLQPDVCGYEVEGRRVVVKDFRSRPWPVRRFWGRWVLRREWRPLERLDGIAGIPRLLGWLDDEAFVMEWLDAERLPSEKVEALTPLFFERLERLVAAMHERGVTHGDLRRKNILVDRDQTPYLIDFATAYCVRPTRRSRRWFERLCEVDRLTVLKLKGYYCPDAMTDEEREHLAHQPWGLRAGRFVRKKVYRPLKPRHLRHHWDRLRAFFSGKDERE
jgi:predicted Ser/Thr protein kinase